MAAEQRLYDAIGEGYPVTRRTEPRIAARIWAALGDARTMLNVGAGTGSYEPPDRDVIAVEPSAVMRAQRPQQAAPCLAAVAGGLPFRDRCFDAAMAVPSVRPGTYPQGVTGTATRAVAEPLLPYLRRARDHIDRHYSRALDLDQLAAVAGVSKFHFARCFEATYGETPIRYLTRRRIERAQDLLRAANLTVTEICMLVGFSSLGSFSSRFAQLVGESPTAYRDRWAARGGPHIPGCYLFMRGVFDPCGTAGPPPGPDRAI